MSNTNSNFHRKLSQAGMVSLMVTLIMMLVISLIVLGFAEVSRRNSREALDRQLNTQAYYAAESGVNDALTAITANESNPSFLTAADNSDCTSFIGKLNAAPLNISSTLDSTSNVAYTCLLVNNKPKSIVINVTNGASKVETPTLSGPLQSLTFSWPPADTTAVSGCPNAITGNILSPTGSAWACPYGMLRLDLTNLSAGFGGSTLATNTVSYYMVPTTAAGASQTGSGQVHTLQAHCTATICLATVTIASGSTNYGLRVSGIYKDLGDVTITGKDTAGQAETFAGAQVIIDSTGKAQDELRRVQVRVPLSNGSVVPTNALNSANTICKRFTTLGQPTSTADDQGDGPALPDALCSAP